MTTDLAALWNPIGIGGFTAKNRVMLSAHDLYLDRDRYAAYLAARARGGAGVIVTGSMPVVENSLRGDETEAGGGRPRSWLPDSVPWFRTISDAVHPHGAKIVAQLMHPGSLAPGNGSLRGWRAAWSSSSLPHPLSSVVPKAMDDDDIAELIAGFAASARHAQQGGMDGVEIHGAHGYLLHQFLSPLFNRRTDQYGGSAENRARLVVEIAGAIRAEVGPDFTIGLKISPQEHIGDAGLDLDSSTELLRELAASRNIDYYSISGVYHTTPMLTASMTAQTEPGTYAPEARRFKEVLGADAVVMLTCSLRTLDEAVRFIEDETADVVGLVRAQMADPDVVRKTLEGRSHEIRPCVGANQGCWRRVTVGSVATCTVNPAAGREVDGWASDEAPALTKKIRVVVVGAGPGGLQAAETAAMRGAEVILLERNDALGGTLRHAARLPRRHRWNDLVEHYAASLERLGVDVRLGTAATPESVAALQPDRVVVASGAAWQDTGASAFRPSRDAVPGFATADVRTPVQTLDSVDTLGQRVLVVDDSGKYLPLGLADLVSNSGREVHVVSALASPGAHTTAMGTNDLAFVLPDLVERGVTFHKQMQVEQVEGTTVTLTSAHLGSPTTIEVDSIVVAMGRTPRTDLYEALRATGVRTERVGDCLAPREVDDAILEGKRIALAWTD